MSADDRLIRVGHSPDPDDAFMFHALTTGLVKTPGFRFEHVLLDIETLNEKAIAEEYEVSAVSIHAFPEISNKYSLMNCGASMGEGYGPMLVSSKEMTLEEACSKPIAIPGQKTSAHLALKMACGNVETVIVPFDEIMPRIQSGEFNSGVIIHEGQLTWKSHGMNLLLDLGVWWNERNNGLPLPLGGNVVRKNLGKELCEDITEWVKQSIEIAISNPDEALKFARQWGRGIDEETNSKFVQMYVNSRTIDFGDDGRESIIKFLTEGQEIGMINDDFDPSSIEFIGA
ncbi:MAG TPA: ABC transporter substrate-binding protein [Candidatus Poseidoniales archaeon]|nr:MAG: ABC transporter substrate-binding protein [Euryarchaeota archaeon]HHZ74426.1 ABC transporter substrate-binding protein [Candidatus Poseidoniales archaeon]PXY75235.1 MAG: ABC transporter substrate-binding protein [Euryarchaeota archaeon]PXY77257.1 MAG: ABC transporter substrate-binding protein [Euryarchaeota archaeon]PXY79938.1 MAG: ABC transporter substrate-binding protein [Euryarchaeota archaeon]